MSEPNLTSVPDTGTNRWGLVTNEGRRLLLRVASDCETFVLEVGGEQATPERAYLTNTQLRALGAAARMMSGAERADAEAIRANERVRLANLFEENAATLAGFTSNPAATINLLVLLLRLNHEDASDRDDYRSWVSAKALYEQGLDKGYGPPLSESAS